MTRFLSVHSQRLVLFNKCLTQSLDIHLILNAFTFYFRSEECHSCGPRKSGMCGFDSFISLSNSLPRVYLHVLVLLIETEHLTDLMVLVIYPFLLIVMDIWQLVNILSLFVNQDHRLVNSFIIVIVVVGTQILIIVMSEIVEVSFIELLGGGSDYWEAYVVYHILLLWVV